MKIFPIAILTFKEGLRNRVLFGVIIAALFLIVISVLLSGLFMRDILKVLLDLCLSTTSLAGLLVPFFLTVTYVSGDIEKKSIYTILSKPITRQEYLIGKYLGLSMLAFVIMSILTLSTITSAFICTYIYPSDLIPRVPVLNILIASFVSFLGILILISYAIFWCIITTSSFLSTLLILSTYIVGQTVEGIVRFIASKVDGVTISPMVEFTTKISLYVFPNLSAFDLKYYAAHDLPINFLDVGALSLYAICYTSFMLFLASYFINKRDLT